MHNWCPVATERESVSYPKHLGYNDVNRWVTFQKKNSDTVMENLGCYGRVISSIDIILSYLFPFSSAILFLCMFADGFNYHNSTKIFICQSADALFERWWTPSNWDWDFPNFSCQEKCLNSLITFGGVWDLRALRLENRTCKPKTRTEKVCNWSENHRVVIWTTAPRFSSCYVKWKRKIVKKILK